MARHETDREDLMREAVALTRRVELEIIDIDEVPATDVVAGGSDATGNSPSSSSLVVVGFRDGRGWFSVYFEQDPVYTFDAAGRLRRAVEDGFLYRAQGMTLARLERRRAADEVELLRHDLAPDELDAFVARMRGRLGRLRGALGRGEVRVHRIVGERDALLGDAVAALARVLAQTEPIADALPGKK